MEDNQPTTTEEQTTADDTVPADQASDQQQDTFDRAYVEKLRKEAAKYRNQAKELEPLAQKMRELEESKKTDLEKAHERIAELEADAAAAKTQAVRAQVAAANGVPVDLLPAQGDEEALTSAAQALVAWAKKQSPEKKPMPVSNAVGNDSDVPDRDAIARQILGV
ncbi:hypothetical protein [uncultured Corynebacterium sp.]|uniref:hypothetical protein n=1 Tax=uncultured Corynebacterium sp. TaxID=159447 RepID=UPI0025980953|nr:hypothetical protein [uncultured Corynebacterium sp.]